LYVLLTGRRPYDLSGKTFDDVIDVVCRQPIEPPRTGSRDLDAIIEKAMRKEPNERYASAEALSADIERFVTRRPVSARRGAMLYDLSKFLARHRVGGATACLVAAVLAAAGFITVRQSRIATRRFNDVRQLAHSVVFPIYDAVGVLPGSTAARKLILSN